MKNTNGEQIKSICYCLQSQNYYVGTQKGRVFELSSLDMAKAVLLYQSEG